MPAKSVHKTMASYEWIDDSQHETKQVEKAQAPQFNYKKDHMMLINTTLIEQLMTRTLQIKLYGMTESKKKEYKGLDPTPGGIDNLS